MSNQTNVYLVDAQMLYERDARELDLREPATLIQPPSYTPLPQWIRWELDRIGNSDDYHYALHEIEELRFRAVLVAGLKGVALATEYLSPPGFSAPL